MNLENLSKHYFCPVKSVVFDVSTSRLGIKKPKTGAVYTLDRRPVEVGEEIRVIGEPPREEFFIVENPIEELSMPVPMFAVRTQVDKVVAGDILVTEEGCVPVFVTGVSDDGKIKILRTTGTAGSIVPPRNILFGKSGVLVVKNIFAAGDGGLNSILPFLLMDEDSSKDTDLSKILLMMSLGQVGGLEGGMQGMLPMLLMSKCTGRGDGKGLGKILPFLMMQQGGLGQAAGGQNGLLGGINPLMFAMM